MTREKDKDHRENEAAAHRIALAMRVARKVIRASLGVIPGLFVAFYFPGGGDEQLRLHDVQVVGRV